MKLAGELCATAACPSAWVPTLLWREVLWACFRRDQEGGGLAGVSGERAQWAGGQWEKRQNKDRGWSLITWSGGVSPIDFHMCIC